MKYAVLCLVLLMSAAPVLSQDVVHIDDDGTFAERYERAVRALDANDSEAWIGFSVTRMMRENSVMGRFTGDWKSSPTIEELLDPGRTAVEPTVEDAARKALDDLATREAGEREKLVPKRIAVMLRRDTDGRLRDAAYANVTMSFDTDELPIVWLGHVENGSAFDLLHELYDHHRSDDSDVAEDLISTVGLLNTPDVHKWLLSIVDSDRRTDEREQAVFWLGESGDATITRRLFALSDGDRSDDVREAAVFALYRMKSEASIDYLVRLAQEADHGETVEKSRFWLAQKAGDRLTRGSDAEKPSDLEKQAVFALSRLDDDDAITELSSVARDHDNPHVRKQALFWLGQRGDDESLETILEVLRGGQ